MKELQKMFRDKCEGDQWIEYLKNGFGETRDLGTHVEFFSSNEEFREKHKKMMEKRGDCKAGTTICYFCEQPSVALLSDGTPVCEKHKEQAEAKDKKEQ
jgi:hypothetical protein